MQRKTKEKVEKEKLPLSAFGIDIPERTWYASKNTTEYFYNRNFYLVFRDVSQKNLMAVRRFLFQFSTNIVDIGVTKFYNPENKDDSTIRLIASVNVPVETKEEILRFLY